MRQMTSHTKSVPDPQWAPFRFITILAAFTVILGSGWICSNGVENTQEESLEISVLSMKELYPQALSIARDWNPNAFLSKASLSVQGFNSTTHPRASFTFWGPSATVNHGLNVYIRGISPDLEISTDEYNFPPERPLAEPIFPNDLPLDSGDALELILSNGAADFLREHPYQPWIPDLILERSGSYLSEGPLRWRAFFKGETIYDTVHFMIDAYTGEFLGNEPSNVDQ
ncbi:MAG TPA: hypothetical protein G4O08_13365 [Anaerolineae bacterium]|nr:hypothetical protein [Anaerolineae bacterium]